MSILAHESEAAAQWWADELRHGALLDNGDDNTTTLVSLLIVKQEIPEDQIVHFQEVLAGLIRERLGPSAQESLERGDPAFGSYGRIISVDYHPDRILSEAADIAGIPVSISTFPWKTMMHVSVGSVTVAHGYGAPFESIYSTERIESVA